MIGMSRILVWLVSLLENISKRTSGEKIRLVQFSFARVSFMQSRNDWQQWFQLVLIIQNKNNTDCTSSITLQSLLGLPRELQTGRSLAESILKKQWLQSEQAHISPLESVPDMSHVLPRSIWFTSPAEGMWACWSSLSLWSWWFEVSITTSTGHSLLCSVVCYELTSGTRIVQAVWRVIKCSWCRKCIQLSDQLFKFLSPATP